MQSTTIDKTKLLTVANYAKKIQKSKQWVYKLIEAKDVKVEKIDGVIFISI